MVNLSTKFEVSISTSYKDMKDDAKCRKWDGFLVLRGHSRSIETAPFNKAHMSSLSSY